MKTSFTLFILLIISFSTIYSQVNSSKITSSKVNLPKTSELNSASIVKQTFFKNDNDLKLPFENEFNTLKQLAKAKSDTFNFFRPIEVISSGMAIDYKDTYAYDKSGNDLSLIRQKGTSRDWINDRRNLYIIDSTGKSVIFLTSNWIDSAWIDQDRLLETFDSDGNLLSNTYERFIDSQWVGQSRSIYTYDEKGNMLSTLRELKNDTAWTVKVRTDFTYDERGNVISFISQAAPKKGSGGLENRERGTFTFSQSNKRLTAMYEDWNGSWVGSQKSIYTYDEKDSLLSRLEQEGIMGEWQDRFLTTYYSNEIGQVDSSVTEMWEPDISLNYVKQNFWKYIYAYDTHGNEENIKSLMWADSLWQIDWEEVNIYDNNNNQTFRKFFDIAGHDTVSGYKMTYDYDQNNQRISSVREDWTDSSWVNIEKYNYVYDTYGNQTMIEYFVFDNDSWVSIDCPYVMILFFNSGLNGVQSVGYKVEAKYQQFMIVTSVDEEKIVSTYELQQNYPNPFNPTTTISYQLPSQAKVELKVFDILGREVALLINEIQNQGNYKISFDASKLSSGIYIYQIKADNFLQARKMMLVK